MRGLPIRKIPGIGKVTETVLNEVNVTTCGEIVHKVNLSLK